MRRKAILNSVALGQDDPFTFVLALDLGMHLDEIEGMSNRDYARWLAFYEQRAAVRELERKRAEWSK